MNYSISNQIATTFLLAAGLLSAAHADSRGATVPPLPKYTQECTACHMAYPPGMLPSVSWQRIMGNLGKHYGTDASLDAASMQEISAWLQTHAGTHKRVSEAPPQDRITKSPWFLKEHGPREISAEVWKRAAVGSASNCAACHTKATQGSFDENEIKIPR
jgi:mono/diheme cytochrome c family protein